MQVILRRIKLYQNNGSDFFFSFLLILNEVHSNYCKRVCLYANFSLDSFDFSSDFYALDFLRFAWSKILSITISSSWIQLAAFYYKNSNEKCAETGAIFTLNLNNGIC